MFLYSSFIKDWCVLSWSIAVRFGTPTGPGVVLQEELKSMQKCAARFVTGNYNYETGSMTGILGQLKWESFKKSRKDNRLILLYKGLKGNARISTNDLIPKTRRGRNQHSMAFRQGAVARSEASSLGMQSAPSSIPTSGTFFRGDLIMKTFLRPFSLFR